MWIDLQNNQIPDYRFHFTNDKSGSSWVYLFTQPIFTERLLRSKHQARRWNRTVGRTEVVPTLAEIPIMKKSG